MSSSLSEICFEQIKGNYWYGAYGEFKVIMMKDCGWVNATKLCNQGGKLLKNWKRLEGTKQLFKVFEAKILQIENIQVNEAIMERSSAHIRADHPLLLVLIWFHI